MITRIKFIKADLDTVTAASLILDRLPENIEVLKINADKYDIYDKTCLCLECGGDGLVKFNCFDHHQNYSLPCACAQVFNIYSCNNKLLNFINYVAQIDNGRVTHRKSEYPSDSTSVSALFSGMLYTCSDELTRFKKGFELIKLLTASENVLKNPDNFCPAEDPLFQKYNMTKRHFSDALHAQENRIVTVEQSPLPLMYLKTDLAGVHGYLHGLGAAISIAAGHSHNRISISSTHDFREVIMHAEQQLNMLEAKVQERSMDYSGRTWGGHPESGIIGSPRHGGSRLPFGTIIAVLCKICSDFVKSRL